MYQFIRDYNLNNSKQKAIILSIATTDCCHSLKNTNIGYEYETLYVFCPQRTLFDAFGEEEFVNIAEGMLVILKNTTLVRALYHY